MLLITLLIIYVCIIGFSTDTKLCLVIAIKKEKITNKDEPHNSTMHIFDHENYIGMATLSPV